MTSVSERAITPASSVRDEGARVRDRAKNEQESETLELPIIALAPFTSHAYIPEEEHYM